MQTKKTRYNYIYTYIIRTHTHHKTYIKRIAHIQIRIYQIYGCVDCIWINPNFSGFHNRIVWQDNAYVFVTHIVLDLEIRIYMV